MSEIKSNRTSLVFIFITILVDVIGLGIIIPVIPDLIMNLTGAGLSEATWYGGWLVFAFAIMQFLFSPVLGELSDRFGRRPILLMSLLGLGLDYIFHAFAPSIALLFIGRLLAGVTGASYTVATAYIADISTKENKAKNFGLIGAAFGLGFIIGPILGGIAGEYIGLRAPFLIAAGLTLANFVFGLIAVPESLPKEKRRKVNLVKMIPGVSIVKLSVYGLGGLILAFFLASLAGQVMPITWTFFTMEMYDWNQADVGISLAVVGLLVAIIQAFMIGWSVKKFGTKKVIIFGFVFWTVGMTLFAFAFTPVHLYAFMVPYIIGGVAGPTLQSYLSNKVPENEQGNLQGALTQLIAICPMIGSLVFANVFYLATKQGSEFYFPGAAFLLGAIILVAATLVAIYSMRKWKNKSNQEVLDEELVEPESEYVQ
ncbi:MAG: TCR/Tet family MFS transporter [Flavobacteriales bacterium]|nr:TCR/Tet family MFS transporter [Flavobacteriales bacterium]